MSRCSTKLLQSGVVGAFGALCFGCGYLIAYIVTRNRFRNETVKRRVGHYDWQTGKWEWGEPPSRIFSVCDDA